MLDVVRDVKADLLLHLAWDVEPGRFWTAATNLDWVAATLRLVRAFAEAGGRKVVGLGTSAEYDWQALGDGICRERTTPLAPSTLYGAAKHATAQLLEAYARQQGMSFAWARLFLLFGPSEPAPRFVPAVIRGLLVGERVALTEGRQTRDFMYTPETGRALAALLTSDVVGPVNVASGDETSLRRVAMMLAARIGGREQLDLGALESRPDEPPRLVADVTRLHDEVGFKPSMTLEVALDNVVAWWRREVARAK